MVTQALVSLDRATVRLGSAAQVAALSEVSLSVAPGERVALVGANGSGKSTLLRCLHGLQTVSSGSLQTTPGVRQAMLFQRPHLMRMSAQSNVALGLWLRGTPWAQARQQALMALQRVGLGDMAGRNGRALSGGQQQRVALARAWAMQPDVWLLDEPTASLDPHAKREVEALIAAFTNEPAGPGRPAPSLIWASHNLGQVKRLATRVLCLEAGRVLIDASINDFFNADWLAHRSPQAFAFVQGETA
jgi:tungstate transport system ATP-binding protein